MVLLAKENVVIFLVVILLSIYLFINVSFKIMVVSVLFLLLFFGLYLLIWVNVVGYLYNFGLVVLGIMNDFFVGIGFVEKYVMIIYILG